MVQEVRRRAIDGFAGPASKGIVREGSCQSRPTDRSQLIASIPGVRRGAAGVGNRREVAVKVVDFRGGAEHRLLIVGVIAGCRKSRREICAGKGAAGFNAIPRCIIGVREVTKGGRSLLVGEAGQLGGGIVAIGNAVGVRIGHAGPAVSIVIAFGFLFDFFSSRLL